MSNLKYCILLIFLLCNPGCKKEEDPKMPEVITGSATSQDYTSVAVAGTITDKGNSEIFAFGFIWGESTSTIENKVFCNSTGQDYFSAIITGLKPKQNYFFKAFAANNAGISYGASVNFTTKTVSAPVVETLQVNSISSNSVKISGNVLSENGDSVIARGFCWSESKAPDIYRNKNVVGNGLGSFESTITGLKSNTVYYFRAYATNTKGTTYGKELYSWTTQSATIESITINMDRSDYVTCIVEYSSAEGLYLYKKGVCCSTLKIPGINDTVNFTSFDSQANKLSFYFNTKPNRRYFFRPVLIDTDTSYGDTLSVINWINKPGSKISDVDGNIYSTVRIGAQVWMAENLRTTKYRNGDNIGTTSSPQMDIHLVTEPKYQWPAKGDETKAAELGRLYTWFAIADSREICPAGWHVAKDNEWKILYDYVYNDVEGRLSEPGEVHWSTNHNGNNLTGFTARSLVERTPEGVFKVDENKATWWIYSTGNETTSYCKQINSSTINLDKKSGVAVRCVKD
ncbi:MAG TPA: fibrobacter succinogenes major paralogous domain-containing protein [Bacteroidales bacterium]|nr:fibrobacter succinogenes major paralogous domain-containing protein [Bacteroidales bacterium]